MKILSALISTLFVLNSGLVSAESYSIDPAHSKIIFKVKHLGISTVTGNFTKFSGTFEFDRQKIESSTAAAEIDTASINTELKKRDNHLRSPEFFNAEKFPKMTFKSTKVMNVKGNSFDLAGDLTILETTRPIELHVKFGGAVKDPWGNYRSAFTAETEINRRDFGMTWNKLLDTGGLVVGNKVKIILEIEGIKTQG